MDLIAFDIGNSTLSIGLFNKDKLQHTKQLDVNHLEPLAPIVQDMRQICGPQPLGAKTVPVVASSVNDKVLNAANEIVGKALDQRILTFGQDVPLQMKHAIENPESIGPDRLLTAYAAFAVLDRACVVADFGTATTIDCVNDMGIFLGGAIMPGLATAAKALKQNTDALPQIDIAVPEGEYGLNTIQAIQHGIYYGTIGALRELVERYATELGHWPQVVLTGGYAKLIAQKCTFADSLVPNLCLDGIFLAYRDYRQNLQTDQEATL